MIVQASVFYIPISFYFRFTMDTKHVDIVHCRGLYQDVQQYNIITVLLYRALKDAKEII